MGFFDFNNPQHKQLADAHTTGNYNQLDPQQVASSFQGFVENAPEEEVQQVQQEYFNKMPKVEQMGLFSSLVDAAKQNGIDPHQAGVSTTDPHKASPLDLGNLFNLARSSGLLGGLLGGGQSQPSQSGGLGALGGLLGGGQSQSGGLGALGGLFGGNQAEPNNQQQPAQPAANNSQNQGILGGLGGLMNNPIAQAALGGLVSYAANKAFNGNNNQAAQSNQSLSAQANQNLPGPSSLGQPDQTGLQNNGLPPTPQSNASM